MSNKADVIFTGKSDIPSEPASIKAIAELASQAQGFEVLSVETDGLGDGLPKKVPVTIDMKGEQARVGDLKTIIEKYRVRPERRTGTADVSTLTSFIDLVNYHKDKHSAIFAVTSWPSPQLVAVLDYHEPRITIEGETGGEPRHMQHRIRYRFPVTDGMGAWTKSNGELFDQGEFAAFIEDHAAELASPTEEERNEFEPLFKERFANPNELIDLSRALEVFVGAKAKNAVRLASGERAVEFTEEHMNGKGEKVDVPGIFMLSVQAFVDGEKVRIPARLRYRIASGSIKWAYALYRWDWYLRQQVKADLDTAAADTLLPAYEGTPELG
ncbi:hypothetical protein T281_16115 [Rhodomicrobium udaipurense JA643]|uniref:DUF2303 family protein n=1 Tax=Rhodomicrobium udaipurense TaxID=1202716 RepID=A0A8I1GET4_9HYPH|nr:DUF2303 family protein [Rhodomicrobium udaipurense]KAI93532.1 hypothetical protein T281_16115 [Rhodomicrobium udaipurense JA643]MBJ7543233.1 DUF2303 family protein [Rhodomicrobium udaipurense]